MLFKGVNHLALPEGNALPPILGVILSPRAVLHLFPPPPPYH